MDQQKRAFDWIVKRACLTYHENFVPENEAASRNLQGRRSAGLLIVRAATTDIEKLKAGWAGIKKARAARGYRLKKIRT